MPRFIVRTILWVGSVSGVYLASEALHYNLYLFGVAELATVYLAYMLIRDPKND